MIELSSIQEKHNEKYLTLEHLRAFIYKSKLDLNKIKGKNEDAFYGVTCAKDALFLLEEALDKGMSISCYKMNIEIGIPNKVDYSEVKQYLTYLIIIDRENTAISFTDAYEFYETNKYDYLNIEFLFIREEIEKIIGAKIPYIKNLSDVENADLEPLNNNKKNVDKTVSGKSETSYLNIIQALKDELIKIGKFENQTELISYLSERYAGYQGLTESNLRDKFAKANLIK